MSTLSLRTLRRVISLIDSHTLWAFNGSVPFDRR
jgi:hypothetical protein